MHRSRKILFVVGLLLLFVAIAAAVTYHVIRRPARAVYLLPDGNAIGYVTFTPLHYMNLDARLPFASNPEYQDFVAQTGLHFDHDLDNIAFSARTSGELNGDVSAIFTGAFDKERLARYIQRQPGVQSENYAGKTIFASREPNQTLRICILDGKTVAFTAGPSPESMHSIIDKSSGAGETPSLLRDYYGDVPFGSVAWGIVRLPDFPGSQQPPGGFDLNLLRNSVIIVSARYTGSVRFRAESISDNPTAATHIFEGLNEAVGFVRTGIQAAENPDKDLVALMNGIQLQQNGNRVVLNVVVPQETIQKISASH
jgi:hypothetical protein